MKTETWQGGGSKLVRIGRHVLYWSFWLLFYGVVNGSHYGETYSKWFLFELVTMLVKVPYTYFVAYYLLPRFIPKERYLLFGVYVFAFAFIGMIALMGLYQLYPYPFGETKFWSTKTLYMFVDLIYVASPVAVIKMIQGYISQQRTAAQLREEKMAAELQMLKNQLQPHFLFNTLNNIYSMVISGEKQAAGALLKLSDIISYMLYECNTDKVDLAKEMNLVRNYIELEKIRYGSRLEVSLDQRGNVNGKMIAPLLLIPFIENAFKHGVAKDESHPWVRVHLDTVDSTLVFIVENSLPSTDTNHSILKSGIGLDNVKKRIEIIYPALHSLIIQQKESFLVKLSLQL